MRRWPLAALLLIPLADALLLVWVATWLGAVETVALVVLTALVGMLLVRAEGRHALRRLQSALAEGRAPTDPLVDGGLLVAGGAFLLTPGLVTDAIGFLLVLPPTRAVARAALKRFVIVPYADRKSGGFATGRVYTFGFPNDDESGTFDLGSDAYDVEFDDGDGGSKGNA